MLTVELLVLELDILGCHTYVIILTVDYIGFVFTRFGYKYSNSLIKL